MDTIVKFWGPSQDSWGVVKFLGVWLLSPLQKLAPITYAHFTVSVALLILADLERADPWTTPHPPSQPLNLNMHTAIKQHAHSN